MTTISMCRIAIKYTDGSVEEHVIPLWDWFHNNFPINPDKEVVEIIRISVFAQEE